MPSANAPAYFFLSYIKIVDSKKNVAILLMHMLFDTIFFIMLMQMLFDTISYNALCLHSIDKREKKKINHKFILVMHMLDIIIFNYAFFLHSFDKRERRRRILNIINELCVFFLVYEP